MEEKKCKYFTKNLLLGSKSFFFVTIINLKIILWKNRMLPMKSQQQNFHSRRQLILLDSHKQVSLALLSLLFLELFRLPLFILVCGLSYLDLFL